MKFDQHSATWALTEKHLKELIQDSYESLADPNLTERDTALIRGRIIAWNQIIDDGNSLRIK